MTDYKNILNKLNFWEYKIIKEFKENDYKITLWIPEKQIEALINYSQDIEDKALLNNTWDLKRFSSYEKFNKWYDNEWRYLFCLLDNEDNLAWIWWGRPAELPNINEIIDKKIFDKIKENIDNIHTSWIRIYPDYRWKWLAKFMLNAEDIYRQNHNNTYMSVDINSDNIPSQRAYEKAWYIYFANWKNVNEWDADDVDRMIYVKLPKT